MLYVTRARRLQESNICKYNFNTGQYIWGCGVESFYSAILDYIFFTFESSLNAQYYVFRFIYIITNSTIIIWSDL